MKKLLLLLLSCITLSTFAQTSQDETAPDIKLSQNQFTELDSLNLQFSFPCAAFIGEYGVNTNGTDIYVSQWLNDSIARYDVTGNVIEKFVIPGVGHVRDMAFDGQYYYGSPNDFFFYVLDLDNKTLIDTVNVSFRIRGMAYDPVEDVLWASEHWTPMFYKMDKLGNILDSWYPSGVTMNSISGLSYDNVSAQGPFLWGFSQDSTMAMIVKYDIASQSQTGNMIDVSYLGTTPSIAGGLFIHDLPNDYGLVIGGMIQNQLVFALDLGYANTLVDIESHEVLPEIEIYPNPVVNMLNVNISSLDANYRCLIYNQAGQLIREYVLPQGDEGTLQINTSDLEAGMYFISINSNKGLSVTQKFVKAE